MVMLRLLFVSLLVCAQAVSYAQQPCITEPMKGYKGDCEISVTMSPDGKRIYTSDRLSLKIWDVATNKVIEEISPFPHALWNQSNDPDILRLGFKSNYRISTGAVEEIDWFNLKGVELPKDAEPGRYMQQFTIPELSLIFYRSKKGTLKIVDLSNKGKITALDSKYTKMFHVPGTKSVLIQAKDGSMHIYNAESRTFIETDKKYPFNFEPAASIDGRFAALLTDKVIYIFDSQTNSFVSENPVVSGAHGLHVKFTPDKTRYYIFATEGLQQENDVLFSSIFEFSYPDLKLVRTIDLTKVTFPAQSNFIFNPATEQLLFKQPHQFKTHKDMHIFDIRAWKYNGVFSLEEKGSFNNEEKYAAEREQRIRIGNQALNALYDLPASVSPCHSETPQPTIVTHIDDYTNNGTVIIRDDPDDGGRCIVWKFPEGMPLMLYFSTTYFGDKPSANAVHVPGVILRSSLSASGNEVGFNTKNGMYIYRGTQLLYQSQDKVLKAMLNGKALVCTPEPNKLKGATQWPYSRPCQRYELIDLSTGGAIRSGPIENYEGKSDDGNRLFISFTDKPSPLLKWIDMSDPSKVVTVEGAEAIKKSGFAYRTTAPLSTTIADRLTGQSEVIPNFRVPKWTSGPKSYVMRDNYILTFEAANGFKLIDINTAKSVSDTQLFSGWTRFKDMAYLKGIGKILVMDNLPIFTRPNASDEDPGASVFTIDVTTGEITPYLTTINRKRLISEGKAAAAALAYSYTPEGRCSNIPANHRKGHGIIDLKTGQATGVIMGYDCDEDVYVVAYREAYDASAGVYNIRFMKKTREEMNKVQLSGSASYRLCPECGGYPVSFSKKTTSGWSDWEQKSLNIYVYRRKWETKTETMSHFCRVCKGQAWIK